MFQVYLNSNLVLDFKLCGKAVFSANFNAKVDVLPAVATIKNTTVIAFHGFVLQKSVCLGHSRTSKTS